MGTRRRFVASAIAALPAGVMLPQQIAQTQTSTENPQQIDVRMKQFELRTLPLDRLQFMIDADTRFQVRGEKDGYVAMYDRDGQLYDHPVNQSMECMLAINDYVRMGDGSMLTAARENLDRTFQTATMVEGASFFPYHFDFALHANPTNTLVAPWYSGMAQGLALGAASRLYNVTSDETILPYIDSAFESFRVFNSESRPWSPTVDERNNLWIEEYPDDPPGRVLNGLLFAIFGMYDYWLISEDQLAADIIRSALTTVEDRLSDFRQRGSASAYCLAHKVQSPNYHAVHISQLLTASDITGENSFVESALLFANDYPLHVMNATSILPAGHYDIFKVMPEDGGPQQAYDLELDTDVEATFMARQRQLFGGSYYYRVQARHWAPFWIKEGSNGVTISGSLIADPVHTGDEMDHTRGTFLSLPNPYVISGPLVSKLGYPSVDGLPDSENGQESLPSHELAEITAQITHNNQELTSVRLDGALEFWVEGTGAEIAGLVERPAS